MKKGFTILLVLLAVLCNAQSVRLVSINKAPIVHAQVRNENLTIVEFSDQNGYVKLDRFKNNEQLEVYHPSFQLSFTTKKQLIADKGITLFDKAETLKTVEIDIRSGDKKAEVFTQTVQIDKEKIALLAPQTAADMLEASGKVYIQKSQQGGGSPILRGFEASRVLLVVDGVRMNNAIYRSGHLQNAITIDNAVLEKTDVILGPYSLLYGSDAMGGVVHFKTKDPVLATKGKKTAKLAAYLRSSTANSSFGAHANFNVANKKSGLFGAISYNSFGDLKMGKNRFHGNEDFGKVLYYTQRINEKDSMVKNSNPNLHVNTGYSQVDAIFKYLYQPKKTIKFKTNTQLSTSSNIPRFDKLNEYDEDELRFSEWNYGPQNRVFNSFQLETSKAKKLFDKSSNIIAHQRITESRISRKFGDDEREFQDEVVDVFSINSDYIKWLHKDRHVKINYGVEYTYNDVRSTAKTQNIENGTENLNSIASRYPGLGSNLTTLSSYFALQKSWKKKHILKGGLRAGTQQINAHFNKNFITDTLNLETIKLISNYVTGSFGYIYQMNKHVKLSSGISRAFKSPNIDDFGKIFEKKGELTVPNELLKPETAWNFEQGFSYQKEKYSFEISLYNTTVSNLIAKDTFSINGNNSIEVDGDTLSLVTNKNLGQARINGLSFGFAFPLSPKFIVEGSATIVTAYFVHSDDAVPHIPPLYGRLAINYKSKDNTASFYTKFNGEKRWDEFAPSTDNQSESVLNEGSPSWATFNISYKTKLFKSISTQVAIENIFDTHYKTFASGISGAGRNFVATLFYNW